MTLVQCVKQNEHYDSRVGQAIVPADPLSSGSKPPGKAACGQDWPPYISRINARDIRLLVLLLPWIASPAAAASAVATQTLAATISPAWNLSAPATASLARGQQAFQPFQVTVPVNYQARTTPSGSGKITLQVTSDFSPAGGPSASSGALTFTCSGASLGNPCSGTQTASTTTQSPILTIPASACTGGGGRCSGQDPNLVNLTLLLTDDPSYSTGSYSASITFTISAI